MSTIALPYVFLRWRLAFVLALNTAVVFASYYLAFQLRFEFGQRDAWMQTFALTAPWLMTSKLCAFGVFGLYHGWWRFVGLRDLIDIVKANLVGSTVFVVLLRLVIAPAAFPRSVVLLELLLSICVMGGLRAVVRLVREYQQRLLRTGVARRALVVGAGEAGVQLARDLHGNRRAEFDVVGFADDDLAKAGGRIGGFRVLGTTADIPSLVPPHAIDEVLIAIPSARPTDVKRILERCIEARVEYRILPSLLEIAAGRVRYSQMRPVRVEDLLERSPVQLETARLRSVLADRRVLVTGAAGSIGSELCRQLADHGARSIVLFDQNETGLVSLERELRNRFPEVDVNAVLGDVVSPTQVAWAFERFDPRLVMHAAAYKHVPMAELNPLEVVRNNVFGTRNIVREARRHDVSEMVLVSTDKAVRPASLMGATKRVAEMLVRAQAPNGCKFVTVRFGNVLESAGSVVPLFREQIGRGGPVTVTDPEVRRFFMTIPEASQLIIQAATMGKGNEIFILEMGEQIKITDLARHLIELSGYVPGKDIPIVFTGLRPGEKLREELLNDGEQVEKTSFAGIKVLRTEPASPDVERIVGSLKSALDRGDVEGVMSAIKMLVPDYTPSTCAAAQGAVALATLPPKARPARAWTPAAVTAARSPRLTKLATR
jgi:FlaA1/EpsC-like NDP-sugar epimerase